MTDWKYLEEQPWGDIGDTRLNIRQQSTLMKGRAIASKVALGGPILLPVSAMVSRLTSGVLCVVLGFSVP